MKHITVYLFYGNRAADNFSHIIETSGSNDVLLADLELMNSIDNKYRDRIRFIQLNSIEASASVLDEYENIKNMVCMPMLSFEGGNLRENSRLLLRKCILCTNIIYLPVLRTPDIRLWYLTLPISEVFNAEEDMIISAFNAGVKTIAKVLAFEMEKRKVIINGIEYSNENAMEKLRYILEKTSSKPFYMNMQTIRL